jgi:hypothetical protein
MASAQQNRIRRIRYHERIKDPIWKAKIRKRARIWQRCPRRRAYMRLYMKNRLATDPVFKASQKEKARRYKQKRTPEQIRQHKKRMRKYLYKRRRENIQFRIRNRLRVKLSLDINRYNGKKKESAIKLLGCTIDFLRQYLEKQFQPGMSWDNWGLHGWHIDHIRPCVSFDLTKPAQQRICFHYSNLQPLWALDNIRKGAT